MPRKPMSEAERKAFGAKMKALREAKRAGNQGASTMPRGRRARQKAENPMSDAEMVARQQEAAALLGTGGRTRRKSRRGGKRGGSVIAFILGGGKGRRSAGKVSRRKGTSMRKKGNGNNGQTYSQVTSQLPIQVSIEVAEGLFSLASVGVDIYTAGTKSAADDLAFPVVARVLSSAGRWGAQRFLSKKHAGLAASIAHGFSAMNGDRNGNFIRNQLRRYLQPGAGTDSTPPRP